MGVNLSIPPSLTRLTVSFGSYLLTYDPFAFHAYLETIIASNSVSAAGNARQNQSPWLLTDAAHVIFSSAKRRCYTITELAPDQKRGTSTIPGNDFDDEEDWALLDELEGGASNNTNSSKSKRPEWLPKGMEPVYEEQPKWNLLADILREIEDEIMRQESISTCKPCFLRCMGTPYFADLQYSSEEAKHCARNDVIQSNCNSCLRLFVVTRPGSRTWLSRAEDVGTEIQVISVVEGEHGGWGK